MPNANRPGRAEVLEGLRTQAAWAERLASPLYHDLLLRIAADVEQGGLCRRILEPHAASREPMQLPLLFLGAVHRLVLEARAAELAPFYASAGGGDDPEARWQTFLAVLRRHEAELAQALPAAVQTNETARCCALLPGFVEIARRTGLAMHLRELGASAGLNLRWDRYRYETPAGVRGDADSPVIFAEAPPVAGVTFKVASRRGCDLHPVDPLSEDGRLTLLSFLWPGRTERSMRLAAAIEVAGRVPAELERSDAAPWLERELSVPRPGAVTVVFHSVVWPYLGEARQGRVTEILEEAGRRATAGAPLAWLSMEPAGLWGGQPGGEEAAVHLTLWPGGERNLIATAGFHGRGVRFPAPAGNLAGPAGVQSQ